MADKRPNVLVIHADQHRFDCLGIAGNKDVKTPNIDALARDGVVHVNCFSTFPLCTPARYSLLTGMFPHQHLGTTNQSTIPRGLPSFPRILKDAGYRTACVGKMHYTPTYLDVGFETMLLAEQDGPGRYDDDYHRYLVEHGLLDVTDMQDQVLECRAKAPASYHENFGTSPSNLGEQHYSTTWIRDRALDIISQWRATGQMLMVGFIKPHHPFDAPAPWNGMYNPESLSILPGWTNGVPTADNKFNPGFFNNQTLAPESLQRVMAQYYASISQIDACVGEMIKLLKRKGLYDDTLIIYTSDHGEFMGFHHMILKGNYMYDPLIKVPLVVKYPGSEHAGEVRDDLVSIVDITATIIDGAGCTIPRPLWDTMQPLEDSSRGIIFAEDGRGNFMARTRSHKLLLCKDVASQFFDLNRDPQELTNLCGEASCQDEIKRIKAALFSWLAFETRPVHNEQRDAPQISGKNTPADREASHSLVKSILHTRMGKLQQP
jgi:arylsulfatase A-like enzyme